MKIYIPILMLLLSIAYGCDDAIEMTPENSVTFDNGLQTKQDLESALTAVKKYIYEYHNAGTMWPEIRAYISDVQSPIPVFNDYRELSDNSYLEVNLFNSYKVVSMSNLILEGIEKAELTKDEYNTYKGNALYAKAYLYWLLTQRWGDCILIKDDAVFTSIAKTPMNEVVDYAIGLANEAIELLPEYSAYIDGDGKSPVTKDVGCKGAARALLAELCLWQAGTKWFAPADQKAKINETELLEMAEKACTDIINSSEYQLVGSAEEICTNVLSSVSSENIYQIPVRNTGENRNSLTASFMAYTWPLREDEGSFNILSKPLQLSSDYVKNMYAPEDERRAAFFYHLDDPTEEMTYTQHRAYPYKHRSALIDLSPGPSYGTYAGLNHDYVIFRLSRIYLNRAEARAKLGKEGLAIEDMNEIRRRSKAPEYEASEYDGNLQKAVYREFDKEFIFEDERYARTIRNGELIVREFLLGKFKTASIQDFTDGAFFVPYTKEPFKNNDLMRQNIYWSKRK